MPLPGQLSQMQASQTQPSQHAQAQPTQVPPQFQARFQPQEPAAPQGYAEPPQLSSGHALPQQLSSHAPPLQQAHQQQPPQLQGWVPQPPQPFPPQQPVQAPPQQTYVPQPRQPDPAMYDLGNYGVPQTGQHTGQHTGHQTPLQGGPQTMPSARQQPQPQRQPEQWQADPTARNYPPPHPAHGYTPPPQQPQLGQPPFGQPPFGQPPLGQPHMAQPQLAQPQLAQPQLAQPVHVQQQGHQPEAQQPQAEEYEYEEEPPRRSRKWLVAVALIGSIGMGGGMAYAYKHFFGPKPGDRNQVVRAQSGPVKSAPADRGGKQMANTGSPSLNNRLPPEGSSSAAGGDAGTTNSSGVRIVQSVPVENPRASGGSGVPGLQIGAAPGGFPSPGQLNGGPPVAPQQQRQAAVQVQNVPPPAPQPPARQQVARAQPAEPVEAVPAPPRRQPVAIQPVVKEAAATAAAPAAPAASRPKTTGHVAVLGYRRTQLDAMKAMADVQQRYDVLRDKKLEIVQSDETARGLGVIYRIVVGPRAGVDQARELCNQLKQAGMAEKSCYTMAQ